MDRFIDFALAVKQLINERFKIQYGQIYRNAL